MAKLTERVSIDSADISDDDLIHIVHDAGGTPISYKMTVAQFKTFISAITGSGVDNQIAVYNGTDSIEGDTSLTWDGNTITVTGDASNKAQLKLDSDSTQNALVTLNTNGGSANSLVQFQISDLTKYMIGINGEDSDATNEMLIIANGDSFDDDGVIVMKPNGNVGIGLGNSAEPSANKLEIGASDATNASLKIREQSATPATPESGQLRNDAGSPMWYDGTQWVDLAGGGSSLWTDTGDGGAAFAGSGSGTDYYLDINDNVAANTYNASEYRNGNVFIGDSNTFGTASSYVQNSSGIGTGQTWGAEGNISNSLLVGSATNLKKAINSFGAAVANGNLAGNYSAMLGQSTDVWGNNSIAIGNAVKVGTTSADADNAFGFGKGLSLQNDLQTVIGFGTTMTNSTQSGLIAFGIDTAGIARRPTAGFFLKSSPVTYAMNFVMGGDNALRDGFIPSNMANCGEGVFWFQNSFGNKTVAPTDIVNDGVSMYALDRAAGKMGLNIRAEDGSTSFFGDFSIIGGSNSDAEANKKLVIKGTGTTSGTSSLKAVNSTGTNNFEVKDNGVINASNLPTSSAGLSSGDIYNDGGTLKIV